MSGASPRMRVVRLSDGEGEARRKAGLMECSESLRLVRLSRGQGATTGGRESWREHPVEGEGSEVAAEVLEASETRGVVFGVPGGHRP